MARDYGRTAAIVLLLLAGALVLGGIFIYSGAYNIGADVPHSPLVHSVIEKARTRSVANHARDIPVPADLNGPKRISAGAGLYDEMCAGCHLGPGLERTEISQGLYPPAPELARGDDLGPAEQFWTIKHGIKLTAMPAWGKTHSDELIWDMVAFIRQMARLSPARYKSLVASAPEDHDEMMNGMNGGGGDQHAPPRSSEHHH